MAESRTLASIGVEMPKINFNGVSDGFEVIPSGDYAAVLESWKWHDKAKTSDNGYLELKFAITEGEYEGRNVWRNLSESDNALWAMKRALIRLGCSADDLDDEIDLDDIMPDLCGNSCVLTLEEYEYPAESGEMRNNVKEIHADAATV